MPGSFKNKNEVSKKEANARAKELIKRWDDFLEKIESRFNDSLKNAEEICMEQLENTGYDYYTTYRTWQGIKPQITSLIQKIDKVWEEHVEDEMRDEGDFWMDEGFKGNILNEKLYHMLGRFGYVLEGKLSKKFYDHSILIANQNFECTQCNAALNIKKDLFRSQYVTCNYCNTVNTFIPETKFTQIGGSVINNIAMLNCMEEYDSMQHLTYAFNKERNRDQKQYLKNYKKAFFNYYEKFFKERIKLQSDLEERYEQDMERKKKEFEQYEKQFN